MPLISQGVFIVLEGSDGSGKKTQFDLLKKRLVDSGYDVEIFDFPRYDRPSSHFVTKYLNGEYGPASTISPYTASLFFALDRFEAGLDIKKALDSGKIVLSNRYVGSNMAHQGAKFNEDIEKRSFFVWEDSLEFQLLNIPRPNVNIFLRVTPEISFELIKQKAARNYTTKSHDEHENDMDHLKKAVKTYDLLCELFPKDYKGIECVQDGKLLTIELINSKVWSLVTQYLPEEVKDEQLEESSIDANITVSDQQTTEYSLQDSNLQPIKWDISKLSLNAAAELVSLGLNVKIKMGSSWNKGGKNYPYYIPGDISSEAKKNYKKVYVQAIASYRDLSSKLEAYLKTSREKDIAKRHSSLMKRILPMAAQFSMTINLESSDAADLLQRIKSHSNEELRALEGELIDVLKANWPDFILDNWGSSNSAAPEQLNQILEQLALSKLPQVLSAEQGIKMIEAHPRNEFDLLADSMYSFSDLTREEILRAMDLWSYQQKTTTFENALSIRESILNIPIYKFDGIADRITLIEFLNLLGASKFQLQQPTVRYGYDVPQVIEDANLEDQYLDLYDNFLDLFNQLQSELNDKNLNYCMLAGHRIRWQASLSAQDLKLLRLSLNEDEHNALIAHLLEGVSEAHPLIGSYLIKIKAGKRKVTSKNKNSRGRHRKR